MPEALPRRVPRALLLALLAVTIVAETVAPAAAGESPARGPVTNLPLPRFVSMRAETANARRGPSLGHRVDWAFVRRNLPLEVTAEYGQWRRVRDADGAGGWVHHSLLSGVRTALVRGEAPVALRAAPDDGAAIRALAEPGVVGRIEACDGPWCEIAAEGIDGWLPRAAIWGVAPEETIQ
jgi:SH3-like domain-containing protein